MPIFHKRKRRGNENSVARERVWQHSFPKKKKKKKKKEEEEEEEERKVWKKLD